MTNSKKDEPYWVKPTSLFRGISLSFLLIACTGKIGYAGQDGAFLPLAGAKIEFSASAIEILKEFSNEERLSFVERDVPINGRNVINIMISWGPASFVLAGNLRESNILELTAYSHDDEPIWRHIWCRLISKLRSPTHPVEVVPSKFGIGCN